MPTHNAQRMCQAKRANPVDKLRSRKPLSGDSLPHEFSKSAFRYDPKMWQCAHGITVPAHLSAIYRTLFVGFT
jgi:hypothetical protein